MNEQAYLWKRVITIAVKFNEWLEETAKEMGISKDELQEVIKSLM